MAPSLIRSQRIGGRATSEGVEVAEGPQLEASLTSLMTSSEGAETQPSSPSIIMLALRISEPSPTTGPIGENTPFAEAFLIQVWSSSSEGDDHDIGSEPAPHNASKFSHVIEEEMQAATPAAY